MLFVCAPWSQKEGRKRGERVVYMLEKKEIKVGVKYIYRNDSDPYIILPFSLLFVRILISLLYAYNDPAGELIRNNALSPLHSHRRCIAVRIQS